VYFSDFLLVAWAGGGERQKKQKQKGGVKGKKNKREGEVGGELRRLQFERSYSANLCPNMPLFLNIILRRAMSARQYDANVSS